MFFCSKKDVSRGAAVLTVFFLFCSSPGTLVLFISCQLGLGPNVPGSFFCPPLLAATARVLTPVNYRTYPTNGTMSFCELYQGVRPQHCFVAISREYMSSTNTATADKRGHRRSLAPLPDLCLPARYVGFVFVTHENHVFRQASLCNCQTTSKLNLIRIFQFQVMMVVVYAPRPRWVSFSLGGFIEG